MKTRIVIALILSVQSLLAQTPVRQDDHFYRKRVFSKIDFNEKLNLPFVKAQSTLYTKGKYGNTNGMIDALIQAYKENKIQGFKYENLSQPMAWTDFVSKMNNITGGKTETIDPSFIDENEPDDDEDPDEDNIDENIIEKPGTDVQGSVSEFSFLPALEDNFGIIEDRIFSKANSDMNYQVEYLVLFYTDPTGVTPEEPAIVFEYKQVRDILDQTLFANRANDAESKSITEMLDQRNYHSFVINLSGENMYSLDESDKKSNQLVSYEHELWNF